MRTETEETEIKRISEREERGRKSRAGEGRKGKEVATDPRKRDADEKSQEKFHREMR